MTKALRPSLEKADLIKNTPVGFAAHPIEHYAHKESPLGNLVADALKKTAHTDFAYMNPGGVRAPFEAGIINFGNIYKTIPFENTIAVISLTAKELKLLIQVIFNGSRGFGSVSGLKIKLIDPSSK